MKQKKFKLVIDVDKLIEKGKARIMPADSFERINNDMKKARRDFKRKSKMSEIRASKIIIR